MLQRVIRSIHTTVEAPRLTRFSLNAPKNHKGYGRREGQSQSLAEGNPDAYPAEREISSICTHRSPTARTVQQMMDTMERMIEDPFAYSSSWPSVFTRDRDIYSKGRTPWEIKEGEQLHKMRFDMPVMTENGVKLWVEDAYAHCEGGESW